MSDRGIRWRRRAQAAMLLLIGIVLGACREFLFINLNYQIDHLARHTRFSYAHTMFQGWTRGMDLDALLVLKWVLALAFMLAMAALSVLLSRVLFRSWEYALAIVLGFALFALLSLVLHGLARWQPHFDTASIQVSHMLQYPVVLLFLLLAAVRSGPRPSME